MVGFLRWAKSIVLGVLNGIAKFVLFLVLLVAVLLTIGSTIGDGMPANMVLTLDARLPMHDSSSDSPFSIGRRALTIMDIVLALDHAGRDSRVKGVLLRVGSGDLSVPQAEELSAALKRFRGTGKFVTAYAQGFNSAGLGDYLLASSANEIWMQPDSVFSPAGSGAGAFFLRGFFDKFNAVPQIAKRAEYKSAADMYMEKDYTPADREQTTALLQSWYGNVAQAAAFSRKLSKKAVNDAFEASPQFSEEAQKRGLVDKIGYDDDAEASVRRRGGNAKLVAMREYARATEDATHSGSGPRIALIEASGDIVDGSVRDGGRFGGADVIAGDDFAHALREAAKDNEIKAIILRVDSPGGSVAASDQILHAVKRAQAAGKPVIVSMGSLAASGAYYISLSANRIVASPGTITGSIGVLTGKVSIGKSLALLGVTADEIGVGKNALFNSAISPYTPQQWAALNHQADVIYADFTQKVSQGRKLPLAKVMDIAKGRVWSGADAKSRGLVDELGDFWTAVDDAKHLAGIPAGTRVVFQEYPRPRGFFEVLGDALGQSAASARAVQALANVAELPLIKAVITVTSQAPRGGVELRATDIPLN